MLVNSRMVILPWSELLHTESKQGCLPYVSSQNTKPAATELATEMIKEDIDRRESKQEKIQRFAQQISWMWRTGWHLTEYGYELGF